MAILVEAARNVARVPSVLYVQPTVILWKYLCLYNQFFALFHYVLKFLTP